MDISEVEENLFAVSDAKLHGDMYKTLSAIYCKVSLIFSSLESARPRSKSGIQALCSLHMVLEKAKNVLQHCSTCSKLYLAITGDSVLSKFEKAKYAFIDSLRRVEDIIPQSIGCQVSEIVSELEGTVFSLDPSEKQIGDDIIELLQHGRKFDDCNNNNELKSFHQAVTRLGITSSRAALTERRALKKVIERARAEEDKRKESIVAYLLHLMKKYSKLFRSEVSDDNDLQGSTPCSPTVQGYLEGGGAGGNGLAFERQLSKLSSFNFKRNIRSGHMPLPPEELRCPISLQLMHDPVIIASGQTYERICIEKWFSDGHDTCPKTQQEIPHLFLTPNYSVKGLVASWCEQNGVPIPNGPPESLDFNYWRLALSESETTSSRSKDSAGSCNLKGDKAVPLEESVTVEKAAGNEAENGYSCPQEQVSERNVLESYQDFLSILNEEENLQKRCKVVEQIRLLLKDDDEFRIFMGANGFVEGLLRFLSSAVHEGNTMAQEIGAMALFNLAVNNDRNKGLMLASGVIQLLENMVSNSDAHESAAALYLNLSCLEQAKSIIGSSTAVPFLVRLLGGETDPKCKLDALHTLYNLSTVPSNIPSLLFAGIINGLQSLVVSGNHTWIEKSIAVLINIASSPTGKDEMVSAFGLISGLASVLDAGESIEQEQAVSCLLLLCTGHEKCSQMVLQEGVIPALVLISVNGTTRGREKAQKLLVLFREQRQRDQLPVEKYKPVESSEDPMPAPASSIEMKPFRKSASRRKIGKAFSFLKKSKSYTVCQC
ncbi:U-box domain-containing protein 7 [Hibiscus syriacus]|uniref:RING-type E3 ubiquitin transferase n=1 Tax=Hibiscus syriacus TaxID=106335 RepID=A0A6A2XIW9_HIBSY|nr:U-box domain-containing protein 6-like [Hibiscus syriacus]XP_039055117.1 U-box domain-containing protein 6-like [Hibiscus syriacus]XP_039055118.1 U-box domain-containing protein 6-like [Hibiscus syriacus]XP_039055119.1 U-box domain-containing protein 6-like [Hibiscus syriacus]KAE8653734.1 U-box domain-containing protein 7 [Hibiscus syriacus]